MSPDVKLTPSLRGLGRNGDTMSQLAPFERTPLESTETAVESVARRLRAGYAVVTRRWNDQALDIVSVPNRSDELPTLRQLHIDSLECVRR